jgi:serine/threonine protein kinase
MGCFSSTNLSNPKTTRFVPIKAGVKQLRQIYNINPKVLGAGSFGKVFLAENKQNVEHKVAIKVI